MSLSADRPLSQAMRYAHHRLQAPTIHDKAWSAIAFSRFLAQFDGATQHRMHAVYRATLDGGLVEDRRSRGKQLW